MYTKLQGHWIIEMSEMLATSSAKSIEEIRSFISRQKETYRTPYESQPKDRLRQCVFGSTSNRLDFLPLDRAGNRRFLPVMVCPEDAEIHILEDEDASRAYHFLQVWAEAMEIYRSGRYSMKFSKPVQRKLVEVQKDFMPEDSEAGMIIGFLENYRGNQVCSKQLYREALHHEYDEPKRWQIHDINEIMNTAVTGWRYFSIRGRLTGMADKKGWERIADSGNEPPGNEPPGNEAGFFGTDRKRSPSDGDTEGVDGMILSVGCRAGCHFVVGFVAGKSASLLPGNADIYRLCCYFL